MTDNTTRSGVNRHLLILYATETGTARETADRISRECRRAYFQCRVCSMDMYSPEALISETLVLFVVTTTGSGAEPRAMTPLWNLLLRSHLPHDLFEDLDFSVFGLGDSAYERFCWPAKKLSKRLLSLGAREICPRGEGDDQHRLGLDSALEPWIENLLETLFRSYLLDPDFGKLCPPGKPLPRVITTDMASAPETFEPYGANPNYFDVTFQDVRHFEFISDRHIEYNPGDVAVIHPIATGAEVDSFLLLMGWANLANVPFSILHSTLDQTLPDHIPRITTLRVLFTHHLDFNAVPRRSFFQILRYFTTDDSERERLDEFLSLEGAVRLVACAEKHALKTNHRMNFMNTVNLSNARSTKSFPSSDQHAYHETTSSTVTPAKSTSVAIVKYRTKLKMPRKGICTSYLANLRPDDQLQIRVEKGVIKLPDDPNIPVICVGPGTGIAPMRAVIEDRIDAGSNATTLYFGCRSKHKDRHYGTEWETYAESKRITYRVAFSRDGPEGTKRTYVQDLILKDKDSVWDLLNDQRGTLIISGSSNKMPAAVRRAISNIAEDCGKMLKEDALKFVNEMERQGRLIEECWS
ncbi:riboflavin synthase domain-like protein [Pisolithus microcarpus]|nr:riboflavin synthase domain-like protein [Pisolithus microcarpus]